MKPLFLAAAAIIAMPALAQTTPATPDQTTPAGQSSADASTMPPPAGSSTTPPPADGTMTTQTTTTTAPMTTGSGDPVGGYQPSAPPMSGPAVAGQTPVFQQAPSPDQAYPAPAPLAHYPICKKGEFDKCMQGPRSTHSREVRGRSSR